MNAVSSPGLLELYLAQEREVPAHIRAALERLSKETPYGIPRSALETPMMKQWLVAKEEVPDALLFFRMGDFFELFGADAVIAGDLCGLTITSRDRNSENPVPMAGLPAVNYRPSIKKCVAAGFKVTVCDQVEDPRQAKGIVRREIIRIATPAVPGDLDDEENENRLGTYLAALHRAPAGWTIAYVDASTGDFRITGKLDDDALDAELTTLSPREVIVQPERVAATKEMVKRIFSKTPVISPCDSWIWRSEKNCLELFAEFFEPRDLNRFGVAFFEGGLQTVSSLLAYLKQTQRSVLANLKSIESYEVGNYLVMDEATKRHLDFFATAAGERRGSLYWLLNRCVTGPGARLLARRLNYPFSKRADVERELSLVRELVTEKSACMELGEALRATGDLGRLTARAAQGSIDPRGMAQISRTLLLFPKMIDFLCAHPTMSSLAKYAQAFTPLCGECEPLAQLLATAVAEEPAVQLGKGRVFCEGYSRELDEILALETNFDQLIDGLEKSERERTQISTLKVGYTKVFGYYFEISKGKLAQTPAHFIRKQTLTNGERFITPELKELEDKALSASERRQVVERELFEGLRAEILQNAAILERVSGCLAHLDVLRSLAEVAESSQWCAPEIIESRVTAIENSVHPVMVALNGHGEAFVPNNIAVGDVAELPEGHFARGEGTADILLITGPNMAGKSTVMRQAAIAQILFQMGSFVPGTKATMGLCDKVFTRIGSGDFALRNQSTFMVEMLECTRILRHATRRSLLLIDELGRGTSTFDGLALAWAILEDLSGRVAARALFSTHYHEILAVSERCKNIKPMQMEVIESAGVGDGRTTIAFSRRFSEGAAGRSYGLHVAALAGIPDPIIDRAVSVMSVLASQQDVERTLIPPAPTSPVKAVVFNEEPSALLEALESTDPDSLSPREAHELLYRLKEMAATGSGLRCGHAGLRNLPTKKNSRKSPIATVSVFDF